jgi:hypothetical protein
MVAVARVEALPWCGVISVVTEFMVDVARVEAPVYVTAEVFLSLTVVRMNSVATLKAGVPSKAVVVE